MAIFVTSFAVMPIKAESDPVIVASPRGPVNLPVETAPYIAITGLTTTNTGIEGITPGVEIEREQLLDIQLPADDTTFLLRIYVEENCTGWKINEYVLDNMIEADNLTGGYDTDGNPWVNETAISEYGWRLLPIYINMWNSSEIPIWDRYSGFATTGVGHDIHRLVYSYTNVFVGVGIHTFVATAYAMVVEYNWDLGVYNQSWKQNVLSLPIYVFQAETSRGVDDDLIPIATFLAILSILSLAVIVRMRRK